MLVSVFTPSHDTRYLDLAYDSLAQQSLAEWEWIVLLNGKATGWKPPVADERVKVSRAPLIAFAASGRSNGQRANSPQVRSSSSLTTTTC